jgi:hypothetical protein
MGPDDDPMLHRYSRNEERARVNGGVGAFAARCTMERIDLAVKTGQSASQAVNINVTVVAVRI